MTDLSRRKLLTGFWQTGKQANIIIRPPWSVSELTLLRVAPVAMPVSAPVKLAY